MPAFVACHGDDGGVDPRLGSEIKGSQEKRGMQIVSRSYANRKDWTNNTPVIDDVVGFLDSKFHLRTPLPADTPSTIM